MQRIEFDSTEIAAISASLVDQKNWYAINAVTATPTAELIFDAIYQRNPYQKYPNIPVTLYLGCEVQGAVFCKNTSPINLMMQTFIWFRDPNGQERGYYQQPSATLYRPGESSPVGTRYVTLDIPGNWFLRAELYAEVA